jgi:hypothetical protein
MTTHRLTLPFIPGNCLPKTKRLSSPANPIYLFPKLKITLNDRNFYTIEVIEAESQAMLNTLTEHDLQNAFKEWQNR